MFPEATEQLAPQQRQSAALTLATIKQRIGRRPAPNGRTEAGDRSWTKMQLYVSPASQDRRVIVSSNELVEDKKRNDRRSSDLPLAEPSEPTWW